MGRKKQNPADSEKRARIVQMAGKMFLSQGYAEVSMDALAAAVPVSKRTLYNHFKDKKALFAAVMHARCATVFRRFEQALEEGRELEETLINFGKIFLNVVLEPEGVNIYRTAITQAQHFPDLGRDFYEAGPSRSIDVLASYLKKMNKKGVMRMAQPRLAASVFLGMLKSPLHIPCMLGLKKKVSAREKTALVKYAVHVFLHGQWT